jgi:hypothetical protein
VFLRHPTGKRGHGDRLRLFLNGTSENPHSSQLRKLKTGMNVSGVGKIIRANQFTITHITRFGGFFSQPLSIGISPLRLCVAISGARRFLDHNFSFVEARAAKCQAENANRLRFRQVLFPFALTFQNPKVMCRIA